ncbi:MAG: hypothetical protein LCH84_18640 [Gemmatimonadetes bacterium]|nr:hypothetical protein [Gemmatimonadota bacterium]
MWADTLLTLERGHLQRLLLWAAASVVIGTALLALLAARRSAAPLLRHFAIQCIAWGLVDAAIVGWAWRGLAYRDFAGVQKLLNILWLNVGLDAGYAAVGITIALLGWRWGARLGAVGAGVGVVLQGLVLALLDLRLIALVGPLR